MWENRCSYSEGLLLCSISLSTTGCLTGSPDKEKIHGRNTSIFRNRYSENLSHETLSGTTEAHCWPFWPLSQCQDPLCQRSRELCSLWDPMRHSNSLCVHDAVPLASVLSQLDSMWPELVVALALPAFALVS